MIARESPSERLVDQFRASTVCYPVIGVFACAHGRSEATLPSTAAGARSTLSGQQGARATARSMAACMAGLPQWRRPLVLTDTAALGSRLDCLVNNDRERWS